MTRPIKFRAFDKQHKVMMYEGFYVDPNGVVSCCNDEVGKMHDPNQLEIMQFTNLFDQNGKEIWEGDVVIILDDIKDISTDLKSGQNYRVVYWDGSYMLSKNKKNIDYLSTAEIDCEVIGNIYENPELLESEVGK